MQTIFLLVFFSISSFPCLCPTDVLLLYTRIGHRTKKNYLIFVWLIVQSLLSADFLYSDKCSFYIFVSFVEKKWQQIIVSILSILSWSQSHEKVMFNEDPPTLQISHCPNLQIFWFVSLGWRKFIINSRINNKSFVSFLAFIDYRYPVISDQST